MVAPSVYREVAAGGKGLSWRVPPEGRLRCLSRVKGDFHARFLGGRGPVMAPGYPTESFLEVCVAFEALWFKFHFTAQAAWRLNSWPLASLTDRIEYEC